MLTPASCRFSPDLQMWQMWVHLFTSSLQIKCKKQIFFFFSMCGITHLMWVARKQVVLQSCLESNSGKRLFFVFFLPVTIFVSNWKPGCVLKWVWVWCCQAKISFFLTVGRMWDPGGRGLALGDPGKLCHAVVLPSLPVGSQPAHRGGNHHHGDWLSRMRGSCQGESSPASYGKWQRVLLLWPLNAEYQLTFTSHQATSSPTQTTRRTWFCYLN